jgi:hypothetical protein
MEKREVESFKTICSGLAEHSADYLVVMRTPQGELIWKSSDKSWAVGVCERYITYTHEQDRLDLAEEREKKRKEADGE